ncbi:MAG TPA: hypothetical protein VME86_03920 [Acidobacteriaceae bacterium]|nr:hypothetical protein [Acidobacteriaceae bacterium]
MERISAGGTLFQKRIFPVIWFGFLAFFFAMALAGAKNGTGPFAFILIVPVFLAVVGFVVMKKSIWNTADEVLDAGDSLIVRKGGEQEQIPLSNIINIGGSPWSGPPRVTLKLRVPGRFGDEVSFYPRQTFMSFQRNAVVEDLIRRVDAAREAS